MCRYNCPDPKCGGQHLGLGGGIPGEYGLPQIAGNTISSAEYGPPEYDRSDYGHGVPPAAYPDPRHPADVAGAFSENQPDVVPSPQAQTSAQAQGTTSDPSSSPPPSVNNGETINLPPPPPPGHSGYSTVKRKDDNIDGGNLVSLGGRPRSVEGLDDLRGVRRRRETETMDIVMKPRIYKRNAQEMTDVNTSRTIQVVAPGDVNFALNSAANAANETVVIQSARSTDSETVCMSVPSFVGGLVMLLLVLAVASLVAAFLFVRVRQFDRKGVGMHYVN